MIRVGLFGSVGTGKDTLAHDVSSVMQSFSPVRGKRCKVRHIQEFSVLYTDKTGGTREVYEQFFMWHHQRQWDHDFDSRMNDPYAVVISSAPAPLAYFYALYFSEISDPKHRWLMADLYKKALDEILEYDIIFYLPLEFRVPEGDRLRKRKLRVNIDRAISSFLENHKIKYTTLKGSKETRVRKAAGVLKKLILEKVSHQGQAGS